MGLPVLWQVKSTALEFKRNRVDAVTQAGRLRTVFKDVPQVPFAATAMYLVANHQPAAILG